MNSKPTPKIPNFFRIWTLYGSVFAGAVGSLMLIGVTALLAVLEWVRSFTPQFNVLFQGDGFLSSFERLVSNGLEYFVISFVMLFLVFALFWFCAVIPATIVGLVYEVLNKYLRSDKVVLTVTYCLAALFSAAYGVAAIGVQYDGMPFVYVPLALATGLIACNITLRFRHDVLSTKRESSVVTA